ncbi:AAA family ATPase [Oceanivirga miroungae]|uniref:AAA-ATPase-like domain-containing protein n=1 Tax=Oceanivirga miroungae TaxID=1130046 RepID=A0A6I8MDX0_9FUSO|nr:AAA family ATPase [Oceanivirga miroungae]VWL85737.1 hypothetical protein OMES3154_01025 [Oceanivirga miroungae]
MIDINFKTGMHIQKIGNDTFYIDKTMIIDELIDKDGIREKEVVLVTRPRRFGKSVALQTIDYFFNIESKDRACEFFSDKKIAKTDKIKFLGTRPIIYLDFKNPGVTDFNELLQSIIYTFDDEIDKFILNPNIDDITKKELLEIKENIYKDEPTANIVQDLLSYFIDLYYYTYKIEPIVLIDEYDSFVLEMLNHEDIDKVISFYRTFFGRALKGNRNLHFAVLAGVTELTKNSVFSAMNNVYISNVLDSPNMPFTSYFGFTQDEIDPYIKLLDLESERERLKNYFDGYKIGGLELYNPDSISKTFDELKLNKNTPLSFKWVETGSQNLLTHILEKRFDKKQLSEELLSLIDKKEIEISIDKEFNIDKLNKEEAFYTFLLYAGYLTATKKENDKAAVVIPNVEVQDEIIRLTTRILNDGSDENYIDTKKAFSTLNIPDMEKQTKKLFKDVYHYDIKNDEKTYRNSLAVLINLLGVYTVKTEQNVSNGRLDIALIPFKSENRRSVLLELKVARTEKDIEKKHKEALEQIKRKEYVTYFNENQQKDMIALTVVFNGYDVSIKDVSDVIY